MIHIGRSFSGHSIEDKCPCPQAPCGLIARPLDSCDQHGWFSAKTMRQFHYESQCKGKTDGT